jgi:hypothetical protein
VNLLPPAVGLFVTSSDCGSDGALNLHDAYLKEFHTARLDTRTEYTRHIRLEGDFNNNKMERMNGEISERLMRGLETKDSPILAEYQLFHNYIRPHMALDGRTPAEVAGIKIEGENKWLTLIQNASKKEY